MQVSQSRKIASLSLISQKKLENVLLSCGSKKDLIIDQSLIKPLEKVCGVSWLRQQGVEKIYKLESHAPATLSECRVYFIPACLIKFKRVLDQINASVIQDPTLTDKNVFFIIILPRVQSTMESLLEEKGLSDIVTVKSFMWEFISMDDNVISLELPFVFKSVFIEKNYSVLNSIAIALWSTFQVVGRPDIFLSIGKQSASVIEICKIFQETFSGSTAPSRDQDFGAVVLVDRDQDYASSLLTPSTYTGLLSEIFNIKCGNLELDVTNNKIKSGQIDLKVSVDKTDSKDIPIIMPMSSFVDPTYNEIKYRHFSEVFSFLSSKAKTLKSKGDVAKEMGINEMKHYVATELQQVATAKKNLANHVLACETIVSELEHKFEELQHCERSMLNNKNKKFNLTYVEENFCTDAHMFRSLRHLCLLSLTQGLSYEEYNSFVTKYLHSFGHKFLYIFNNLSSAGLLVQPASSRLQLSIPNLSTLSDKLPRWQSNFQIVANKLKQLPSESEIIQMREPTCPSYVFNGSYIPLVAAICKIILKCENANEMLTKLSIVDEIKIGGSFLESNASGIDRLGDRLPQVNITNSELDIACKDIKTVASTAKSSLNLSKVFPLKSKSILIYVIGGVTYAEIAACNLLEKLTGGHIVIGSDSIVSGDSLINGAL